MVTLKKYQNKKIAIYGMGKTGCSAAKAFEKLGSKVFCWDDNKKVRKKIKDLDFSIILHVVDFPLVPVIEIIVESLFSS